MSLNQYSTEQLQEMSLIEIAYEYLKNSKQAVSFHQLMEEMTSALNLSEEEVKSRIAQFYTDLNIDGRFLALGENRWGLRVWYPVDTAEEEVVTAVKSKKKKTKKVVDEDLEDFDEVEDDLDYDDLDYTDDDETEDEDFDELDVEDDFEEDEEVVEDDDFELEEDLDEDLDDDLDSLDEEIEDDEDDEEI